MATNNRKKASPATQSAMLTKAVLRAAAKLEISNKVLSGVIGLSEATISRMNNSSYTIEPGQKPFELGVLFVRLYRSLDAIVGGEDAIAAQWLSNKNTALGDKPVAMIQTVAGLTNVIQYLDARRAVS